jgi:hypothetical protein
MPKLFDIFNYYLLAVCNTFSSLIIKLPTSINSINQSMESMESIMDTCGYTKLVSVKLRCIHSSSKPIWDFDSVLIHYYSITVIHSGKEHRTASSCKMKVLNLTFLRRIRKHKTNVVIGASIC